MKKKLLSLLLLVTSFCIQEKAFTQVDLTATGGTLIGTYTTLNDAFASINAGTHTGVIEITISGNTTEPAVPMPLASSGTGSSSYTSILIKPSGDVTVNSNAAPTASRGMIEFLGADNVTIDGDDPLTAGSRNLTFSMVTSTTTGLAVIRFASVSASDGATFNTVRNCNIIGSRSSATSTTTNYGIYSGTSGTSNTSTSGQSDNNDNLTLENNIITRAYWGIYCAGTTTNYMDNLIIRNNIIGTTVATDVVANRGIYIQNTQALSSPTASVAIIEGNDIQLTTSTSSTTDITAIEIANGNCGAEVRKNNIHDVYQPNTSGYGAYGIWITGTTNNSLVNITNNFIRDIIDITWGTTTDASDFNAGIMITVGVQNVKINQNTISLQAPNGGTNTFHSACLYIGSGTATIAELQNNIFVNTQGTGSGSFARGVFCNANGNISGGAVNGNNYYTPGSSGYAGRYNAANHVTLAAWQTATTKDANSYNVNPLFTSSTDLHIPAATNSILESGGVAVAAITDDIDSDSRPGPAGSVNGGGTANDVGADEFDGTPLNNCSGAPAISNALAIPSAVCVGVNFDLSLDVNYIELGYTYQWESSVDDITYSPIGGATNPTLTTTQTGATYYHCIITCTNSGMSTTSASIQVMMSAPASCYCTPAFSSAVEPITLVDFAGINNTTSETVNGTPALEDFTTLTANVTQGSTYPITVKGNTDGGFTNYIRVFIDFNQNGSFADAGESFDIGTITGSTGIDAISATNNILIPFSSTPGITRMRVIKLFGGYSTPCNTTGYGQAEDYLIDITAAVNCTGTPTAGVVSGPTSICSGVNFNLDLTGHSTDVNITLQWESSPDGITYAPIGGATNATYSTSITSDTYFQCVVTCTSSGMSATTLPILVTLNPFTNCYCAVTYPSNVEPITLVDFAGINNATSEVVNGTPAQEDFTSMTAIVNQGQTYPITLKGNTDGNFTNNFTVYIDFNQNGSYADAGERFDIGTIVNSTGIDAVQLTGNITIPMTAMTGVTGLRVSKKFNAFPSECNSTGFGQTEDYTIEILPCVAPATITLTADDVDGIICPGANVVFNGDAGYPYYDFQINSSSVQTGSTDNYSSSTLADNDMVTLIAGYDATCATSSNTITITHYPAISASVSSNDASCTGIDDGTIDLTVTGGTSPIVYDWDNDGTGDNDDTEDLSSLAPNTYNVIVIDANGCTDMASATINVLTTLAVVSSNEMDATCFGFSDGSIDMTYSGGTGPFTYDWDNDGVGDNDDTEDLTGLSAGTYVGVFTDANGCNISTSVVISEPTEIVLTFNASDISCNGLTDGAIDLSVTGGAGSYSYDWDIDGLGDNDDAEDLSSLSAGSYTVLVTDGSLCSVLESVTINEPAVISASALATDISCNGLTDGSIDLTVTGGTAPYVYDWDNDGTGDNDDSEDLSGLSATTYNVTVTDVNGCPAATTNATVNEPAVITITSSVTDANCDNSADGAVDISVSGGTGAYTFSWSNAEITEDISGVMAGSYTVDVTDVNGCTANSVETVGFTNTSPTVTLTLTNDVACNTESTIMLSGESPTGGIWSGTGVTGTNFDPSVAGVGTHTITYMFTDGNGCANSATDDIQVDDCTGITENEENLFQVYPNPSTGMFIVSTEFVNGTITIRDAIGKVVYSNGFTTNKVSIDLTTAARGVYYITLSTEEGNSVQKIVKN